MLDYCIKLKNRVSDIFSYRNIIKDFIKKFNLFSHLILTLIFFFLDKRILINFDSQQIKKIEIINLMKL